MALAGLLALAGGGLVAYVAARPAGAPATPPAAPAAPVQGLPEVRPPDKLTTTRERELLALLAADRTKPEDASRGKSHDVIRGSIELGLLYLKERRLPEAAEQFKKLENRGAGWRERDPIAARSAGIAGRLGWAVVLANENKPDKAEQSKLAEESNKLFADVVTEPAAKFGPKGDAKFDRSAASVTWLLLRHPDLSTAVADALNRNAANLGKSKLDPPALELLRSTLRVGK
jgi:serine/threonine-protein kinase